MKIGVIHTNWQRIICFKEVETIDEARELAKMYTRMFGWAEVVQYEIIQEYDREELENEG
ncbi:MAG: hypothetical protein KatS3mg079_651 [Caloramator sp.]|nr:MAG: hypothetical protein KatS3mg079_651 [Caloramator sp.]